MKVFEFDYNSDVTDITLVDYLPSIKYIDINNDMKYFLNKTFSLAKRNSMTKISDTKFAILLNEYTDVEISSTFNHNLLILICTIFNNAVIQHSLCYYFSYFHSNNSIFSNPIYENRKKGR